MGLYFCENCDGYHDSDHFPPVEFTGPTSHDGDLTCQEPVDPSCANCRYFRPGRAVRRERPGFCISLVNDTPDDPTFGCNRFKSKEE